MRLKNVLSKHNLNYLIFIEHIVKFHLESSKSVQKNKNLHVSNGCYVFLVQLMNHFMEIFTREQSISSDEIKYRRKTSDLTRQINYLSQYASRIEEMLTTIQSTPGAQAAFKHSALTLVLSNEKNQKHVFNVCEKKIRNSLKFVFVVSFSF